MILISGDTIKIVSIFINESYAEDSFLNRKICSDCNIIQWILLSSIEKHSILSITSDINANDSISSITILADICLSVS